MFIEHQLYAGTLGVGFQNRKENPCRCGAPMLVGEAGNKQADNKQDLLDSISAKGRKSGFQVEDQGACVGREGMLKGYNCMLFSCEMCLIPSWGPDPTLVLKWHFLADPGLVGPVSCLVGSEGPSNGLMVCGGEFVCGLWIYMKSA